jgi:N utilization substance protein B
MGKRRKARESALQVLFQLEFDDAQPQQALERFWENRRTSEEIRKYTGWLVKGIITHREEIDSLIQSASEHWRISRMAVVDRNVLRMAVFELLHEQDLAPAIVINEAIEIAKKYSSGEAATFINGILDAISKKMRLDKDILGKDNEEKE